MAKRRVPEVVQRKIPAVDAGVPISRTRILPKTDSRGTGSTPRSRNQVLVPDRPTSRLRGLATPTTGVTRSRLSSVSVPTQRTKNASRLATPTSTTSRSKVTRDVTGGAVASNRRDVESVATTPTRARRVTSLVSVTGRGQRSGEVNSVDITPPKMAIGVLGSREYPSGGVLTVSEV